MFLKNNPDKTKVAAGLACGTLWTVCKSVKKGDIILSPNGHGYFMVGEITGDYYYVPGGILPRKRSGRLTVARLINGLVTVKDS